MVGNFMSFYIGGQKLVPLKDKNLYPLTIGSSRICSALILGFSIGLPGFSFAIVQHYLFLILMIGALHLLLSAPLALLACISRGYLVPIGFAFTTLMLALVFGPTAIGAYLPWSVPALHLQESGVSLFPLLGTSYLLVFLIGLLGLIGTVKWLQNREQ
ncbi:hypothetical protein [Paenibacillus sp. AD87]|uniref:hypothetical protein n=1 Tax=Paenibacillus sp. AD87 TaxID=1528787 RepID=UPI0007FC3C76|nr:hypothetical protein [Paenibacillus sp. AD87]OAX48546.1 hypothetical protein gpAD87_10260 [Paenibacillus sp. AD87]